MRRATTQEKEIMKIERETIHALDKLKSENVADIESLWLKTKEYLKMMIGYEYRKDFQHGNWNLVDVKIRGTIARIGRTARMVVANFREDAGQRFSAGLKKVYWESVYRHAYQLDITTPPSFKVKIPAHPSFTEAINVRFGPEAVTDWRTRWAAWMDSYNANLESNLVLGAMNESLAADAAAEVDATMVGSPSFDIWDALNRIMLTEMAATSSLGESDIADANEDLDIVEIWKTREWERVCDDCEPNNGLPADEADGEIPLHPNCACYYRLVPASWAELLRSGDADDVELAKQMDAQGRVPSSMLVRDDQGNLRGAVMITFDDWMEQNAIHGVLGR